MRSSMKTSHAANDNLNDRHPGGLATAPWARSHPEDARQIAANVTGFFSVLAEWSRAEMPASE